jgi:hypothetical protein
MNTGYCKDCQDYNSCESEYKEPSGSCDLWQPVLMNREELREEFEDTTGEKVLYRKGSSVYHALKYVGWLEDKLIELERKLLRRTKQYEATMGAYDHLRMQIKKEIEEQGGLIDE